MTSIRQAIDNHLVTDGAVVILDFTGITAVNGSYIKSTAFWLFQCGRLSADRKTPDFLVRHSSDPRPCDVFVAVAGLTPDVEVEFIEFFAARSTPLLIAKEFKEERIFSATLEGHLDSALKTTLDILVKKQRRSAPQLHEEHPEQGVTVTAWNNRLTDLHALRLVRRKRSGKTWEYEPIAERISYGRSIH